MVENTDLAVVKKTDEIITGNMSVNYDRYNFTTEMVKYIDDEVIEGYDVKFFGSEHSAFFKLVHDYRINVLIHMHDTLVSEIFYGEVIEGMINLSLIKLPEASTLNNKIVTHEAERLNWFKEDFLRKSSK